MFGIAAAAFGAAAVALGAFATHVWSARLDEPARALWRTAVDYQFWHALALLACAGWTSGSARWRLVAMCFVGGIVLFCGSLYLLALGAPRTVGLLTPCGGLALIAGWVLAGFAFWREASRVRPD